MFLEQRKIKKDGNSNNISICLTCDGTILRMVPFI